MYCGNGWRLGFEPDPEASGSSVVECPLAPVMYYQSHQSGIHAPVKSYQTLGGPPQGETSDQKVNKREA